MGIRDGARVCLNFEGKTTIRARKLRDRNSDEDDCFMAEVKLAAGAQAPENIFIR